MFPPNKGKDDAGERMECAELPRSVHPFYFAVQFHPEFKSRPERPSPPFYAFVAMAKAVKDGVHLSETDIGVAGRMWRNHLRNLKNEIRQIYSPKRFVAALLLKATR